MANLFKMAHGNLVAATDKVAAALLSGMGFNAGEAGTASGSNAPNPNYETVTVDFTDADWNTAAFHTLITITKLCHVRMLIECVASVDSAGHGATLSLGTAALVQALIKNTDEALIDTDEVWNAADAGLDALQPTIAKIGSFENMVIDFVSNGEDVGITVAGEAMTTGSLLVHYVWEPMEVGATCVVGTGA